MTPRAPAPAGPAAPPPLLTRGDPSLKQAHWLLTFTFALFVIAVAIGLTWDRAWHATHLFDSFYVPPHLFTYTMALVTAYLVNVLVFVPRLRLWFGNAFRVPLLPFAVPGALVLAGGGLVTLGLAGILDDIWHSNFGLDETGWSTPHNMIGWALLVTVLGFLACRLALRPYVPPRWYTIVILGLLVLVMSAKPFIGPMESNQPIAVMRGLLETPIVRAQPSAQHTFRIYIAWNLTRTNPFFVPLAALWAGAALAFLRRLAQKTLLCLSIVTVWSVAALLSGLGDAKRLGIYFHVQLLRDPANWLPIPLLPTALVYIGLRTLGAGERWSWLGAGVLFSVLSGLTWSRSPLAVWLTLAAIPLLMGGAVLGKWAYATVTSPRRAQVWALIFTGFAVPFVLGMVDLYLRRVTP